MTERILMVIDGDNLWKAQKDHLNFLTDPGKIKEYVSQFGEIIEACYYASTFSAEDDMNEEGRNKREAKDRFFRALAHMGYSVIQRNVKHILQEDGSYKGKASMDVLIARDICLSVKNYDMLVLVSGDGDFACVLDALKNLGKTVKVMSTENVMSRDLREMVGQNFIELKDIREFIERDGTDHVQGN